MPQQIGRQFHCSCQNCSVCLLNSEALPDMLRFLNEAGKYYIPILLFGEWKGLKDSKNVLLAGKRTLP